MDEIIYLICEVSVSIASRLCVRAWLVQTTIAYIGKNIVPRTDTCGVCTAIASSNTSYGTACHITSIRRSTDLKMAAYGPRRCGRRVCTSTRASNFHKVLTACPLERNSPQAAWNINCRAENQNLVVRRRGGAYIPQFIMRSLVCLHAITRPPLAIPFWLEARQHTMEGVQAKKLQNSLLELVGNEACVLRSRLATYRARCLILAPGVSTPSHDAQHVPLYEAPR